ncbi:sugar ABC transporter permease [Mangrovactinospora gilvigrisea]|uniref:Sugar ABC transporter permease n=1 Tax=Mangrovactinospora gilvigrisea TaxID=1428644 RepID=A0A1J7C1M9_9ACTN|nr:carbohydrate ABC transporter permease [Mangrovactinospora gilvigrisea]OIV35472.1 sugar ABC transporter permease [Mangrovactinospora gilvigrisea]
MTTRRASIGSHAVLAVGALVMVVPFIWQIITSLKTIGESTQVPPGLWPAHPQWSNFDQVFTDLPFGSMFLNTALVAVGRTVAQLLFCSLAGYAFARLRFPGRNIIFAVFLALLMVPSYLLIIPQYQVIQSIGWLNTVQGIMLPGMFSAFGTFLLRQFFAGLPPSLDEAARIDGANPLRIWWSVMLPLVRPGLAALAVLTFLWSWNDLLWPLVVITSPDKMTLSPGLASLQSQFTTNYPVLMAGALVATVPVIAVFIVLQRQFIEGVAAAGNKG